MQLLGRVALVAQRSIVIKLSRGRSVGWCVGLSSALWTNGVSDPDTVWIISRTGPGMRHVWVWGSVHGKGYFGGKFGARHCNQSGTLRRTCATVLRRGPLPKLLWANLL